MRFLVGVVAVLASSCAGERVGLDDWGPVEIAAFINEVSSFTTSNLTTRYYICIHIYCSARCVLKPSAAGVSMICTPVVRWRDMLSERKMVLLSFLQSSFYPKGAGRCCWKSTNHACIGYCDRIVKARPL